jgi:hypothetical protein
MVGKAQKDYRKEIISLLGNKCANPYNIDHSGFEQSKYYLICLQIDHINSNGNKERKIFKGYKHILKQVKSGSKDYQCLCPTCNWIKRYVNEELKRV